MRPDSLFAPPPSEIDPAKCNWYHIMDVPGYGTTRGGWDLRGRFSDYIGNVDVSGKSLLDVGTASGFVTFSAEQRGAREVVSFDIDIGSRQHLLPFKDSLYFKDHATWSKERTEHFQLWKNAYWFAHKAFGSNARVIYGDIYNIPEELGLFDIVIMNAVLEHMSDPIRAMASVSRHAEDTLVLGVYIPSQTDAPIAWFLGDLNRPNDDAVFWAYSLPVYEQVLGMLGFMIERVVNAEFLLHTGALTPRSTIVARRIA